MQKYFLDTYNRETKFIPNGVSRPEIVEAVEITKNFGIQKDKYILFLGRLVPEKGIHYLIEAFKSIKTDKRLVIAGGASDSSEYAVELKQLSSTDPRIIFTGFVQGRELEELYSNAYVYVLPSDLEGMPLSLLEAMSYGNCCLTSDIPECADVLGDFGITFKHGNVQDLKDTLTRLCSDPKSVERFKEQAADYICNRYNWDNVTRQTLQIYGVNEATIPSTPVEENEHEGVARK